MNRCDATATRCANTSCPQTVKQTLHNNYKFLICARCSAACCSHKCHRQTRKRKHSIELCDSRVRTVTRNKLFQMFVDDASVNTIFWFRCFAYDPTFCARDHYMPSLVQSILFENPKQMSDVVELSNVQQRVNALQDKLLWIPSNDPEFREGAKIDSRCAFIVVIDDSCNRVLAKIPVLDNRSSSAFKETHCLHNALQHLTWSPTETKYGEVQLQHGLCFSVLQAGPHNAHHFVWSWLKEQPSEWLQMSLFDSNGVYLYGQKKITDSPTGNDLPIVDQNSDSMKHNLDMLRHTTEIDWTFL